MSEPKATPVSELIEMLSASENEGGTVVFDHTPEEIGLHVMENYQDVLAALAAQSQPAATVQEMGREALPPIKLVYSSFLPKFADNKSDVPTSYEIWISGTLKFDKDADQTEAYAAAKAVCDAANAALTAEPAAKAGDAVEDLAHDIYVQFGFTDEQKDRLKRMIRAAFIATPPSPQPDMGSGRAIGLIGEASFAEVVDCDFWSLQLHFGKGDDARDKMRAVSDALRSAAALSSPASQSVEKDALKAAYEAGALAVHEYWQSNPGEAPRGDPEFGEAASDYAAAALPHKEEATPAPVAEQGLREALKRAAIDLLHTPRHNRTGAGMTPEIVIHPGEIVAEEVLPYYGLTVTAAAKALRCARPNLSNFLNGKGRLSPEMALKLEAAFGLSSRMLCRMQATYDLAEARSDPKIKAVLATLKRLEPVT